MNRVLAFSAVAVLTVASVSVVGQSAFAESQNYKQSFTASLSGANEVPAVQTAASGTATFGVSQDERSIDYTVSANAENVTAAHIHCAAKNANGPVIVGLFAGGPTTFNGEVTKGTITGANLLPAAATCSPNITNTSQFVQAMREGTLYVNVHSQEYPSGLIRGQITDKPAEGGSMPIPAETKFLATSNPDGVANDALVGLSGDLSSSTILAKNFAGITSIQSIQSSRDGNTYATADGATGTGSIITMKNTADPSTWTMIAGANTKLAAPKGIEVIESRNALIVSDNGTKDVKVFAKDASGNVAPLFTVANFGGVATRNVWDTSYDTQHDTLYVAGTDGTVIVYDDFFLTKGVDGPTKLIIPANNTAEKLSVNLHGIAYVPERDSLVLTDVGSATNATDGQVFTINNIRQSSGRTPVTLQVVGVGTTLGNPVDLAYDGQSLYVAEKSNDKILKFNDIFGLSGTQSTQPSTQLSVLKPESVDLK